jgi:DNA-directed RNA polymerase subunit RPC12/RpoP
MGEIKLDGYICERCSHLWVPRLNENNLKKKPLVCPKCKSPYWNIPKKIKKKVNNE